MWTRYDALRFDIVALVALNILLSYLGGMEEREGDRGERWRKHRMVKVWDRGGVDWRRVGRRRWDGGGL